MHVALFMQLDEGSETGRATRVHKPVITEFPCVVEKCVAELPRD